MNHIHTLQQKISDAIRKIYEADVSPETILVNQTKKEFEEMHEELEKGDLNEAIVIEERTSCHRRRTGKLVKGE